MPNSSTIKQKRDVSRKKVPVLTRLLAPTEISEAAEILAGGGLVAFPTETVYGLGADATNGRAVAAIYTAKGRPQFNPLIVHVASLEQAETIAVFDADARALAAAFWPGPLTLVLPLRAGHGVSELVTAGLDTVGLRMPASALARDLITRAGVPLAAPSANPSGHISPTTADHVMVGLSGRIDAVMDDGACIVGLESTIISTRPAQLLRPGGLPVEAIEACLSTKLQTRDEAEGLNAPGQMASHYAPTASLRLNASDRRAGELLIGFGDIQGEFTLSTSGDLTQAAAQLFAVLHEADARAQAEGKTLAVAPIPDHGLGRAINDRLRRAAAPRPAPLRRSAKEG